VENYGLKGKMGLEEPKTDKKMQIISKHKNIHWNNVYTPG
jgi:hypothetical protein